MTDGSPADRNREDSLEDVEARRERQMALLESVGRFAGGIAHDFNNLLSTIVGYGELLEIQLKKRNDSILERNDLAEIQAAAVRATELTQRLQAFAERLPSRPREIAPQELVRGIERVLSRLAPPGVQFTVTMTPVDGLIEVDRSQMERAITYLVVNGFDAMKSGGTLAISVDWRDVSKDGFPGGIMVGREHRVAGACVDICVTDSGPGMSAEQVEHAFQPYVTSKTTEEMGAGLGLPAVFGLVVTAKGVLVVDSRTRNAAGESQDTSGTSVHVLIPRLQ